MFGVAAKEQFQFDQISFNPIAVTLMRKALSRVVAELKKQPENERFYKTATNDLIDSIVANANGDVRNAVINFHFALQKSMMIMF